MLYHTAEAVAVSDYDDVVDGLELGEDFALPERHYALYALLESLGAGNVLIGDVGVAGILSCGVGIGLGERERFNVVAAAPDENLLVAVLGCGLGLVKPLEHTVMLLIKAPGRQVFSTGIQSRSIASSTLLRVLTALLRYDV